MPERCTRTTRAVRDRTNAPRASRGDYVRALDRYHALTERVHYTLNRTDLTIAEQERMCQEVQLIIKLRSPFLRREKQRLEQKYPRLKRGREDTF